MRAIADSPSKDRFIAVFRAEKLTNNRSLDYLPERTAALTQIKRPYEYPRWFSQKVLLGLVHEIEPAADDAE